MPRWGISRFSMNCSSVVEFSDSLEKTPPPTVVQKLQPNSTLAILLDQSWVSPWLMISSCITSTVEIYLFIIESTAVRVVAIWAASLLLQYHSRVGLLLLCALSASWERSLGSRDARVGNFCPGSLV